MVTKEGSSWSTATSAIQGNECLNLGSFGICSLQITKFNILFMVCLVGWLVG